MINQIDFDEDNIPNNTVYHINPNTEPELLAVLNGINIKYNLCYSGIVSWAINEGFLRADVNNYVKASMKEDEPLQIAIDRIYREIHVTMFLYNYLKLYDNIDPRTMSEYADNIEVPDNDIIEPIGFSVILYGLTRQSLERVFNMVLFTIETNGVIDGMNFSYLTIQWFEVKHGIDKVPFYRAIGYDKWDYAEDCMNFNHRSQHFNEDSHSQDRYRDEFEEHEEKIYARLTEQFEIEVLRRGGPKFSYTSADFLYHPLRLEQIEDDNRSYIMDLFKNHFIIDEDFRNLMRNAYIQVNGMIDGVFYDLDALVEGSEFWRVFRTLSCVQLSSVYKKLFSLTRENIDNPIRSYWEFLFIYFNLWLTSDIWQTPSRWRLGDARLDVIIRLDSLITTEDRTSYDGSQNMIEFLNPYNVESSDHAKDRDYPRKYDVVYASLKVKKVIKRNLGEDTYHFEFSLGQVSPFLRVEFESCLIYDPKSPTHRSVVIEIAYGKKLFFPLDVMFMEIYFRLRASCLPLNMFGDNVYAEMCKAISRSKYILHMANNLADYNSDREMRRWTNIVERFEGFNYEEFYRDPFPRIHEFGEMTNYTKNNHEMCVCFNKRTRMSYIKRLFQAQLYPTQRHVFAIEESKDAETWLYNETVGHSVNVYNAFRLFGEKFIKVFITGNKVTVSDIGFRNTDDYVSYEITGGYLGYVITSGRAVNDFQETFTPDVPNLVLLSSESYSNLTLVEDTIMQNEYDDERTFMSAEAWEAYAGRAVISSHTLNYSPILVPNHTESEVRSLIQEGYF